KGCHYISGAPWRKQRGNLAPTRDATTFQAPLGESNEGTWHPQGMPLHFRRPLEKATREPGTHKGCHYISGAPWRKQRGNLAPTRDATTFQAPLGESNEGTWHPQGMPLHFRRPLEKATREPGTH